jgi:hypothetical protein
VAAKLAVERDPTTVVAYCDTGSEHEDNRRFLDDCARWLGRPIEVLRSASYRDIWDVFERTRYLVGIRGARCTTELKKLVRRAFERPDDVQVFGFDAAEGHRAERFRGNNPEVSVWFPLIDAGLSKADCLAQLQSAGIELPAMYKLGYRNNNCIGCVKGQAGYWNKIRKDFPEVYARMATVERQLGVAICKHERGGKRTKMFLDELPEGAGRYEDLEITCGLFCGEI